MPETTGSGAGRTSGRQQKRIEVGLMMIVRGKEKSGAPFEDTVHSNNVSRTGASFVSERDLQIGMDIEITIPARPGQKEEDFITAARIVRAAPGEAEKENVFGVQFSRRFLRVFVSEGSY